MDGESRGVSSEQYVTYRKKHTERKGLEEELVLAEVQVPGKREEGGKKERKERDGPVVGLVVQQHHEAPTAWA